MRPPKRSGVPVLMHSAAFAYLDADRRATAAQAIAEVGTEWDLAWISLEGPFLPPFDRIDDEMGSRPENV